MKTTQIISIGLLGLFICVPFAASAEESTGGAMPMLTSVSAEGGTGEPATPEPILIRESPTLPSRPNMLRESPSKGSAGAREDRKPAPVHMMASGTRPLPPMMERALEQRDKRLASSSREDCIGDASGTTDCVGKGAERRDAMKNKIELRTVTDMREHDLGRRSEILKHMAKQMSKRMSAAIERIEKLSDRVDSRIAKLKEKGVDTSSAAANIVIARSKTAEARAAVALAEAAIAGAATRSDAVTGSTTPSDAGKPVREALEKARIATVAAHKAVVDAIESLKEDVKTGVESHKDPTSQVTN